MNTSVSKGVSICLLLSSQLVNAQTHIPVRDKPNIIVILSDDLGYGDPVCYGGTKLKTPNINQEIKPSPNDVGFDYSFIIPGTNDRVPRVYVENGNVVGLEENDPIRVSYKTKIGNLFPGKVIRILGKMNCTTSKMISLRK